MTRTLQLAQASPDLEVGICVTGMHLSPVYGHTVSDVERAGLDIIGRVEVDADTSSGASTAVAIGRQLIGFTQILQSVSPDLVLLLGDRGEMLAGAVAAIHLNIPVVHIHGGERSGTVDEPVRHAISKLAHYHFVATSQARERLIRMGEHAERVFVTGAPGLDGLEVTPRRHRHDLCAEMGFDPGRPIGLVIFHPVLQEAERAGAQMRELISGSLDAGLQVLCLRPNSDAGASLIREVLDSYQDQPGVAVLTHLPRRNYISWMAAADVMVGNSSSGIIEAASVGLPVINAGSRQQLREHSDNVTHVVEIRADAIRDAIVRALRSGRTSCPNIYGDGTAGERIVALLARLPADPTVMNKCNAY